MPTEPRPTESTPGESTAIDRNAHDSIADAAGETESGNRKSNLSGDASETESEGERDGADPDGDRVAALERRITELEAELEAVHGLLDGVEAVDETVERRADAALAKVEALEERFAPEAEGLVRERLPDAGDDGRREEGRSDRTGRQHNTNSDPDGGPRRAGSRIRDRSDQEAGRCTGSADSPRTDGRASTGTVGSGRANPANTDPADEGSTGTGAISSVGPGAPDEEIPTEAAEESDRSLAVRLRDAFR